MRDRLAVDSGPVIVAMPQMIDVANAASACGELAAVVASGARLVIADLSATVFCDAAGANRLLVAACQAAAQGSRLRLVVPPGALMRRVLALLEIDHLLPVYTTVAEALRHLPGPRHPLSDFVS